MEQFDPKIDAYIAKSPAFAQDMMIHLRELIHQAVPQVKEVIKWGCPHFDYKGLMIGIAAFKEHIGIHFSKSVLMDDPAGLFARAEKGTAGSIGKVKSFADLPADDVLLAYITNAMALNEKGVKVSAAKKEASPKAELPVPDDLIEAFKTNTDAMQHFQRFSPSAKREYLEWLADAKSEATRSKRLETMLEWVAEGKTRHWKYKK